MPFSRGIFAFILFFCLFLTLLMWTPKKKKNNNMDQIQFCLPHMQGSVKKFCAFLLIVQFFAFNPVKAQEITEVIKPLNPLKEWKLGLKTGTAMLMSEVPHKYLENINNVNIPVFQPGLATAISIKKLITPHIEMGYYFDYMRIRGTGDIAGGESTGTAKVLTQSYGHNYTIGYVFRNPEEDAVKPNFTILYKIGALSLKNKFLGAGAAENQKQGFLSNVAVITGLINEFSFPLSPDLKVTASAEYNRTSDSPGDVLKIYKLFYFSPNTVNNYLTLNAGISYRFSFTRKTSGNGKASNPWFR
jgi:hypothetical protein